MTRPYLASLALLVALAGCNLTLPETAARPSPTPNIITIIVTPTPDAALLVAASATPTTMLPASATATPTLTLTAVATITPTTSPTPTITLTPSATPQAVVPFRFDNWQQLDLPDALLGGADTPLVVFTNSNDQVSIRNLATAQPENTTETIYVVNPDFPEESRTVLLEVDVSTGNQIFPATAGTALAYFRQDGINTGLYVLNLANGLAGRVAAMSSLTQRGIYSPPAWSPDGERLAVTLATGYDLDIFLYDRGGAGRTNLTTHGAYDFFPAWSPDGRFVAFVSDRATCPSWIPGEAGACDPRTDVPPIGGNVYLIDVATGETRQLSDQFVTEPPRWLNNSLLAFGAGDRTDLLNPRRALWLANIPGNTVQRVMLPGDDTALYLGDTWSPDGRRVLLQRVTTTENQLVLMSFDGTLLQRADDRLVFPRFGLAASWSPRGDRIALGGAGGQCPYGVRVADSNLELIATGSPPPSMCNPVYAPDGRYLAFVGVNAVPDRTNPDGRIDVYTATFNGYNQKNLSADFRGTNTLIGWLGGG